MIKQRIDETVLTVLKRCTTKGNVLTLPGQLERSLYVKTNKVLEILGGKWSRKDKGHVFDGEAAEAVEAAVMTGEVTDLKKLYQFFETPAEVVDRMIEAAGIKSGMLILEPSAGHGAIIDRLGETKQVVAVELDPDKCTKLKERYDSSVTVIQGDFLRFNNCIGGKVNWFDRVIMNPPFRAGQDVKHVRHAYNIMQDGGRLVSIMSPSYQYRENGVWREFREWLDGVDHDEQELPEGSFAASGTNVRTVMVTIDK